MAPFMILGRKIGNFGLALAPGRGLARPVPRLSGLYPQLPNEPDRQWHGQDLADGA